MKTSFPFNIALLFICISTTLFFSGCASLQNRGESTSWHSLFNGKDINDWTVKIHHHEVGDNYGKTFRVEDKMIRVIYDQYDTFNNRYGHLYHNTPYSHFHLKMEYRFAEPWRKDAPGYTELNSGIMTRPKKSLQI